MNKETDKLKAEIVALRTALLKCLEMRDAQKNYFRRRGGLDLREAQRLEKEVDKLLAEMIQGRQDNQLTFPF